MILINGYLDPSVVSYAATAIAAVAVSLGAVVVVYWRKAKKKVSDKLGIEQNQKKEVEDEVQGGFGEDIKLSSDSDKEPRE